MGNTRLLGDNVPAVRHGGSDGKGWEVYRGTSVPSDAATGYPRGVFYLKTDGGVGTTLYVNEGTETSADFNAVSTPGADPGFTGDVTLGDTSADTITINGTTTFNAPVTVGADDTGHDVILYGATAGQKVFWDESADTFNLDATVQVDGTVTVGVDDTGYDVKFFGATASAFMHWDESADTLILAGAGKLSVASTTTLTGLATLTAGIDGKLIVASTETIASGGTSTALDLAKFHHDIDADAGGDTFTLAAGVQGQIVVCVLKTATGTATITPATFLGGTSVTLDAAGDSVMFRFQTTLGWSVIGGNGYTVV